MLPQVLLLVLPADPPLYDGGGHALSPPLAPLVELRAFAISPSATATEKNLPSNLPVPRS